MTGESFGTTSSNPELDRALEHYREVFDEDESDVISGTVLDMKVGDSGYIAYWGVEPDTAGRYWLRPLFRVDEHAFESAAHIRREETGFVVDFTQRVIDIRDHAYDRGRLLSAEEIDRLQAEEPQGIPVTEVIGPDRKLPGFYSES
jgi:hypothetical protein